MMCEICQGHGQVAKDMVGRRVAMDDARAVVLTPCDNCEGMEPSCCGGPEGMGWDVSPDPLATES